MSVGIFGAGTLIKNLHAMKKAADKAAEQEVKRASKTIETTAKRLIVKGPKTGWRYMREFDGKWMVISKLGMMGTPQVVAVYQSEGKENLGKFHQASAPGEPPANDTGDLQKSIMSKMDSIVPSKPAAVVWTDLKYGKYLEFGTEKIEPRPFMTPALEQNRDKFPRALGTAVIKNIDGAVKK